jgi:CRP-like cAMP-binding protein
MFAFTRPMLQQTAVRNRLLKYLSAADFALLMPHLRADKLDRGFDVVMPDRKITAVWFIESGMVSVVAEKRDGRSIEVGVYGREGMSGSSLLLGSDRTPHHHFMQIEGSGYHMEPGDLLRVTEGSPLLRKLLLRFVHVFMTQTAQSALVNGSSVVEERLARWLLMCHDRIDGDDFAITHDFLSMMLGVRRSSVTDAIHLLEGTQLIKANRGRVKILNRSNLEYLAGASYGLPEAEYRRLIGAF